MGIQKVGGAPEITREKVMKKAAVAGGTLGATSFIGATNFGAHAADVINFVSKHKPTGRQVLGTVIAAAVGALVAAGTMRIGMLISDLSKNVAKDTANKQEELDELKKKD